MPNSELIIDCAKLKTNFEMPCMPVVKGNAYGLGMVEIARFYEGIGVPFLVVSYGEEAIALRTNGIQTPIFVLACDAKSAFDFNLTPALNSREDLAALHNEGQKRKQAIGVHLQLDTGLNRLGFKLDEAKALKRSPWVHIEGVMSHFGADTEKQASIFNAFVQDLDVKWIHMESTNSIGKCLIPRANLTRLGLDLYRHAVCLKSRIVALRTCIKGESVGYRSCHVVEKESATFATLGIGYHDGLPLSGRGHVLVRGQKAPYIGNIYMDFTLIETTGIDAEVGDEVEIFGPNLPLEEVAANFNTNPRQLLCCLGPRVERKYVNIRQRVGALEKSRAP